MTQLKRMMLYAFVDQVHGAGKKSVVIGFGKLTAKNESEIRNVVSRKSVWSVCEVGSSIIPNACLYHFLPETDPLHRNVELNGLLFESTSAK